MIRIGKMQGEERERRVKKIKAFKLNKTDKLADQNYKTTALKHSNMCQSLALIIIFCQSFKVLMPQWQS